MRRRVHDDTARPLRDIPTSSGIGLRYPHHRHVIETCPDIGWLEVHGENYVGAGLAFRDLAAIRERYPLSIHATGLSLGSADGLDIGHARLIAELCATLEPGLVSDHLSWSSSDGLHLPDLLPLPYSDEALRVVAANTAELHDILGRTILVENPSTYLSFAASCLSEGEFLGALVRQTGCGVLLDVNNVLVTAGNLGEDPGARLRDLLTHIPADAIGEIHVAGHSMVTLENGAILRLDDHGSPVCTEVWSLLRDALDVLGPRPVLVEWDTDVPAFGTLEEQASCAQTTIEQCEAVACAVSR